MNDSVNPSPRGAIYLIPCTLSGSCAPDNVLPRLVLDDARRIKHFVVENVRSARRFLKSIDKNIDIDSLTFTELSEHTAASEIPAMLEPALCGFDIGVISEAGCPAVADPGADLVAAAQAKGLTVVPLVGPSSIILGLMASGFNGQKFAFAGYLPVDASARSAALKEMERRITKEHQTQIFIETPYRNNRLIADLCRLLPSSMKLCVGADITGASQHIVTRSIEQWKKAAYDYAHTPAIYLLNY